MSIVVVLRVNDLSTKSIFSLRHHLTMVGQDNNLHRGHVVYHMH